MYAAICLPLPCATESTVTGDPGFPEKRSNRSSRKYGVSETSHPVERSKVHRTGIFNMRRITVVPLGPGPEDCLTLQSLRTLRETDAVFLRTEQHPVVSFLQREGISFSSLDFLYGRYEDFDTLHQAMASYLWEQAGKKDIVYAVADPETDASLSCLRSSMPSRASVIQLPGISARDYLLSRLPASFQSTTAVHSMTAFGVLDSLPSADEGLLITEINSRLLAGEVKLRLQMVYHAVQPVCFFRSMVSTTGKPVRIPLEELDRQKCYDHTVACFIPAVPLLERSHFSCSDLLEIMNRLRSPEGCDWDRQQTHMSLRPYLIEEAYETASAIDADDMDALTEELGDVLLQVVFHASIAQDLGEFHLQDISTAISRKMILRHPHVFGGTPETPHEWEAIKRQEKGYQSDGESILSIADALPALTRAAKILKRAGDAGTYPFSGDDLKTDVLKAIRGWAQALEAEVPMEDLLGNVMLTSVYFARRSGLDPEQVLSAFLRRYVDCFIRMEKKVQADGKSIHDLTLPELSVYWTAVTHSDGFEYPFGSECSHDN